MRTLLGLTFVLAFLRVPPAAADEAGVCVDHCGTSSASSSSSSSSSEPSESAEERGERKRNERALAEKRYQESLDHLKDLEKRGVDLKRRFAAFQRTVSAAVVLRIATAQLVPLAVVVPAPVHATSEARPAVSRIGGKYEVPAPPTVATPIVPGGFREPNRDEVGVIDRALQDARKQIKQGAGLAVETVAKSKVRYGVPLGNGLLRARSILEEFKETKQGYQGAVTRALDTFFGAASNTVLIIDGKGAATDPLQADQEVGAFFTQFASSGSASNIIRNRKSWLQKLADPAKLDP